MPKPTEGKERERKPPSVYNKGEMSEKNISLPKSLVLGRRDYNQLKNQPELNIKPKNKAIMKS